MALNLVSSFANRFKEALGDISITDFAKKIGLSKQAISSYVNGYRVPKRPTIVTIARVLDVNEAWLIGYDVPKQLQDNQVYKNDKITVSIGRGGERQVYELSDADAAIIDAFLKQNKKN